MIPGVALGARVLPPRRPHVGAILPAVARFKVRLNRHHDAVENVRILFVVCAEVVVVRPGLAKIKLLRVAGVAAEDVLPVDRERRGVEALAADKRDHADAIGARPLVHAQPEVEHRVGRPGLPGKHLLHEPRGRGAHVAVKERKPDGHDRLGKVGARRIAGAPGRFLAAIEADPPRGGGGCARGMGMRDEKRAGEERIAAVVGLGPVVGRQRARQHVEVVAVGTRDGHVVGHDGAAALVGAEKRRGVGPLGVRVLVKRQQAEHRLVQRRLRVFRLCRLLQVALRDIGRADARHVPIGARQARAAAADTRLVRAAGAGFAARVAVVARKHEIVRAQRLEVICPAVHPHRAHVPRQRIRHPPHDPVVLVVRGRAVVKVPHVLHLGVDAHVQNQGLDAGERVPVAIHCLGILPRAHVEASLGDHGARGIAHGHAAGRRRVDGAERHLRSCAVVRLVDEIVNDVARRRALAPQLGRPRPVRDV